jgi:hypothetical protein
MKCRSIRVGPQHDGIELLRTDQSPLRLHIDLELLIVGNRTCSDAADRRLNILGLDGLDDIGWRKTEAGQPIRVEPDSHRVIEPAEQEGLPDIWRARQLIDDVDGCVVSNEEGVVFPVFAVERHELQYRRGFLLDCQALELNLLG